MRSDCFSEIKVRLNSRSHKFILNRFMLHLCTSYFQIFNELCSRSAFPLINISLVTSSISVVLMTNTDKKGIFLYVCISLSNIMWIILKLELNLELNSKIKQISPVILQSMVFFS